MNKYFCSNMIFLYAHVETLDIHITTLIIDLSMNLKCNQVIYIPPYRKATTLLSFYRFLFTLN